MTALTYGSADKDTFKYDPNTGRQTGYTFKVNAISDTGTLTWNANGTLGTFAISDALAGSADTQTCNYFYDDLGRLGGQNANGYSVDCGSARQQLFTFDAFGNIKKSGSSNFQPTYSATTNRFTISGGNVQYDGNGNLLRDNLNIPYTWDPNFGNPASVNGINLVYDALGRMVEQQNGSAYTQILYSPAGKTALMNGQTLVRAFISLPAGATAIYNSTGLAYFRHADWLGSSRLTSTVARTVYSASAYAPFGEQYAVSGTSDPSFTGQNSDTVSSLYDFMYREHSPSQGRWISPDPAGMAAGDPGNPQAWNRYAYVMNNPLMLIDPSGLECVWDNGSFDAYDDPESGNPDSCKSLGGRWVDPDLFENAILTNGLPANINPGDWSGDPNSIIAASWLGSSGTAYGGEWAAGQEVDEAVDLYRGNGPKPTIVYPATDPFALSFKSSLGMQGILAGIRRDCSATSGSVPVGTSEAFANTMIDGPFLQSPDGRVSGYYTPEAQLGAFNSTYSRSGGVVDITVTNTISLNSEFLHIPAHLGIKNRKSGPRGSIHQELHITAPDPCR